MLIWLIIVCDVVILDVGYKCCSLTYLKRCVFKFWIDTVTTCVMVWLKVWQLLSKGTNYVTTCVMAWLKVWQGHYLCHSMTEGVTASVQRDRLCHYLCHGMTESVTTYNNIFFLFYMFSKLGLTCNSCILLDFCLTYMHGMIMDLVYILWFVIIINFIIKYIIKY